MNDVPDTIAGRSSSGCAGADRGVCRALPNAPARSRGHRDRRTARVSARAAAVATVAGTPCGHHRSTRRRLGNHCWRSPRPRADCERTALACSHLVQRASSDEPPLSILLLLDLRAAFDDFGFRRPCRPLASARCPAAHGGSRRGVTCVLPAAGFFLAGSSTTRVRSALGQPEARVPGGEGLPARRPSRCLGRATCRLFPQMPLHPLHPLYGVAIELPSPVNGAAGV